LGAEGAKQVLLISQAKGQSVFPYSQIGAICILQTALYSGGLFFRTLKEEDPYDRNHHQN